MQLSNERQKELKDLTGACFDFIQQNISYSSEMSYDILTLVFMKYIDKFIETNSSDAQVKAIDLSTKIVLLKEQIMLEKLKS